MRRHSCADHLPRGQPARPAQRKTQAELEEMFKEQGFMETLDFLEKWTPENVRERYFSFA